MVAVSIIALQALMLYFLGNPLVCNCGYVKIWDEVVRGPQDSQHLLDWYSLAHVVYGFLVYFFLWLVRRKVPWFSWGLVVLLVVVSSAGWEIFENTQFAVRHFQDNTISYAYRGDSIINSVSDTAVLVLGFWLASFLPVPMVILIAVALELIMAIAIRDGVVLGVVMFAYSFPSLLKWQAALSP